MWAYGTNVNPTAYGFGELWTVHTLYYWQRDHAIAVERELHPCFANIRTLADIYNGDGIGALGMAAFEWLALHLSGPSNESLAAWPMAERSVVDRSSVERTRLGGSSAVPLVVCGATRWERTQAFHSS